MHWWVRDSSGTWHCGTKISKHDFCVLGFPLEYGIAAQNLQGKIWRIRLCALDLDSKICNLQEKVNLNISGEVTLVLGLTFLLPFASHDVAFESQSTTKFFCNFLWGEDRASSHGTVRESRRKGPDTTMAGIGVARLRYFWVSELTNRITWFSRSLYSFNFSRKRHHPLVSDQIFGLHRFKTEAPKITPTCNPSAHLRVQIISCHSRHSCMRSSMLACTTWLIVIEELTHALIKYGFLLIIA